MDFWGHKATDSIDGFGFVHRAMAKVDLQEYPLRIKKIYPQVIDGQFRVDLVFTSAQPANISRGQTLQLRLQMGANEPAQLIPNNSFFQDTTKKAHHF